MLEFASPRIIRPAEPRDIELLKTTLPKREPDRDAERLAMQRRGEAVYLLAVQDDVPVGRLLLQWNGAKDVPNAEEAISATPAIEDLFVLKEHRNRKVVSRLLESAERLAAERGYKQVGLAFGTEDATARELYEKHGYVDAGVPPYTIGGKYTDAEGKEQEWHEEVVYLVHPLTTSIPAAETENKMTSDEQSGNDVSPIGSDVSLTNSTETSQTATATEEPVTSGGTKPTSEKPLSDQVVDFAFGVALTAAEILEKAVEVLSEKAKIAQKEAPVVWEAMQDKGRPAREKLVQSLREETKEETDAATTAKASEPTGETETKPVTVEPTTIKPAPRPFGFGRTSTLSAEDEIKALEDRVKALEQEVAIAPTPVATVSTAVDTHDHGPEVTEDVVNATAPTPAEEGTALVYFTTETNGETLSDSPYAVMDEEERAATPTQAGELVETPAPPVEVAPAAPRSRRTKKSAEVANETTETVTESESELEEPAA